MRHPHAVSLASAVPGLKTSAAFLTSLSANLRLPDDDFYPSPMNTPLLGASRSHIPLPPPSPLTAAMTLSREAADAATIAGSRQFVPESQQYFSPPPIPDDLPPLTTYPSEDTEERIDALKLVADSIAQQRQLANTAVIFHPLVLSVYIIVMAALVQRYYHSAADLVRLVTTAAGTSIAGLFGVRYFTEAYIHKAEEIGWDWLGDDQILVTKWGNDIIGALVLGWSRDESRGRKKKGGRGVIRAWTVKMRYRGKGVGKALLEEAVDLVSKKGGDGIDFADDHANSTRLLKPMFNKTLDRDEQRGYDSLQKLIDDKGAFSRSRRQRTP